MPIDNVDTFLDVLEDSLLLSSAQVEECLRERAKFPDTKALAKHLLQRDWLTPFQVNNVLQGRAGELVLGQYLLLERIGQGGMGQVFKARHQVMGRVVALKVIKPEHLKNADSVERFLREVRAAGKLKHPNIVTAYDANHVGNTHFLVMEYVDGIDLARLARQKEMPVALACDFIRQAALGLQHAHDEGMVHRDIKPGNLLVEKRSGTLKILDMGLARLQVEGEEQLTVDGAVMGTADYMSPEQALGSHDVDGRADIYSLGCTLYFLLTRQPPFPGGTLAQKFRRHEREEAVALESLRPDIPAWVAAAVRKMMAKNPAERFQSAAELARVLERCGVPEELPVARPVALPVGGSVSGSGTHPVAVPLAPSSADSETIPPSTPDSVPSEGPRLRRKPVALDRALKGWRQLGKGGQIAVVAVGGTFAAALLLAVILLSLRKPSIPPVQPGETRPWYRLKAEDIAAIEKPDWQAKQKGLQDRLVAVLGEHRVRHTSYEGMVLRPDGKLLAMISGRYILLVDPTTLRELAEIDTGGIVRSLAFSGDGKLLVSGGDDEMVHLWDGMDGAPKAVLGNDGKGHFKGVTAVAVTRDGKRIFSAGNDKIIRVWDVPGKTEEKRLTGHTTPITALAITLDGTRAFSAGGITGAMAEDLDVRAWDVEEGSQERVFSKLATRIVSLAVSPDGKWLLAGGSNGDAGLWSLKTDAKMIPVNTSAPNQLLGVGFLGNERFVTCSPAGSSIWDWNAEGARRLRSMNRVSTDRYFVCTPDGKRLIQVNGTTVRVFDTETGDEQMAPQGHFAPVHLLAFDKDGRHLLSAGRDRRLILWDGETGQIKKDHAAIEVAVNPASAQLNGIALSQDATRAVVVSDSENLIRIYELTRSTPIRVIDSAPADVRYTCVALSPDGKRILTGDTGKLLRLWDAEMGKELFQIKGHQLVPTRVQFLSDSEAVSLDGNEIRFWKNVESGSSGDVWMIPGAFKAFPPDRSRVYSSQGSSILVYPTPPTVPPVSSFTFLGMHQSNFTALALSPDGKSSLFSASAADELLVGWDLTANPIKSRFEWHIPRGVASLAYAPDGRHVAVGLNNTTIYMLRMPENP
jgi:serine/threonine-protein kinase